MDKSICSFGAAVLIRHLQAVQQEVEGVRQAEDIEYIHRMRVATRRTRAALPLFAGCLPAKRGKGWSADIRRITRALGAARDTDVQINSLQIFCSTLPNQTQELRGIRRLLLRLQQQRTVYQQGVLQALARLEADHTLDEMLRCLQPQVIETEEALPYSAALYHLAHQSLQKCLDLLLSYEPYIEHPECKEELHAMRIAAKQLRYTLETFAPLYPNGLKKHLQVTRAMQDLLGNLHDCDVWVAYLPQFIEEERQRTLEYFGHTRPLKRLLPAIHLYQADRQQERERIYAEFVQSWQQWRAEEIWETLQAALSRPLLNVDAFFPPAAQPQPEQEEMEDEEMD